MVRVRAACIVARLALLRGLHCCAACIVARLALLRGLHCCEVACSIQARVIDVLVGYIFLVCASIIPTGTPKSRSRSFPASFRHFPKISAGKLIFNVHLALPSERAPRLIARVLMPFSLP
ncbi:hypothetical protein C8R47DRAFT_1151143 [Mycena vitilis]|nr:hypothetical protein C8R47DRAFT_1151143 [Mycena vitilis]